MISENYFDADFDFEAYIRERLLEIEDMGDRIAIKKLMEKMMIPFYRNTELQYNALVKSIRTEEFKQSCNVVTAVAQKQGIDIANQFLFPMCESDMDADSSTKPRLYIKAAQAIIDRIKKERRIYKGRICSKYGEYEAGFILKPVRAYVERLKWLYKVFEQNGQAWKSVCAPHLGRFFDVQMVLGELPAGEELTAVYINLEEYEGLVEYDCIPLWNIRVTGEKSSAYPKLAVDQIQYVHSIYSSRLNAGNEYLVENDNTSIWKTELTSDGLEITCDSSEPAVWKLVEFCKFGKWDKGKDIYSNAGNECPYKRCIHTIGEVRRFVSGLGYDDRLRLADIVSVNNHYKENRLTYSMDSFIEDEICRIGTGQRLLFQFEPCDADDYLNYDILSYLLSRIQWELPQFECIGELV